LKEKEYLILFFIDTTYQKCYNVLYNIADILFRSDKMKNAHSIDNRNQTIKEHLIGVAEKAASNSVELMRDYAYKAGIAHDIGKYAEDFQKRLKGSTIKYEHSACGAIEIGKLVKNEVDEQMTYMLQYCIAGHHTGLPDGGTAADNADTDSTLHAKLKRMEKYKGTADYSSYKDEVKLELPDYSELTAILHKSKDTTELIETYAFFTRYLFSCLTDADYIDTEIFYSPDIERGLKSDFVEMLEIIDKKLNSFTLDTQLKKARKSLQDQAFENCLNDSRINILDMPTGSGKTLCSMKIALKKLVEHKKKRIIYVIPYTSIIEQTAEIFEKIFGKYTDIVQHHSNYCYDTENDSTLEKLKRSTENWDAPVIITTSVQFFRSLYHYNVSSLRKLHNIADSVIVFDEVHMLPKEYLQPCLRAIGYITKYLNSGCIFLSATMPDYTEMFKRYIGDNSFKELITDKKDFSFFQKCIYSYIGMTDMESIAEKAMRYGSSLIIVNSRKTARNTYQLLSGRKYHLSTYMTPQHRSETIEHIREDLINLREHPDTAPKITVVSTSLVEAGVDFDFQAVFRQLAGLDSILQSGGRCNRDGNLDHGDVFIFEIDEKPKDDMKVRSSIVKDMLDKGNDISSEECIKEYYNRLFNFSDDVIEENTIAKKCSGFDRIPFRTYAESFELIKDETISIVIDNCDETSDLLAQIRFGGKDARRKLQRFTVSLKLHGEFDNALKSGLIHDTGYGVYVLSNNDYYKDETGLDINYQPDYIY